MRLRKYLKQAAFLVLLLPSQSFAADQLDQLFKTSSQGCSTTVKVSLIDAARAGIDKEVERHEAALQVPPSLSQLGCLDDLFNVNLDIAIQVPNLQAIFQKAVSDAENQLCSYAQQQWDKLTQPLQDALQLPSFNNLQLPGLGGGSGGPSLDFNSGSSGELNLQTPEIEQSGPREDGGSTLNGLYDQLYGGGGS